MRAIYRTWTAPTSLSSDISVDRLSWLSLILMLEQVLNWNLVGGAGQLLILCFHLHASVGLLHSVLQGSVQTVLTDVSLYSSSPHVFTSWIWNETYACRGLFVHRLKLKVNIALSFHFVIKVVLNSGYCITGTGVFTVDSHSFLTDFRPSCDIQTSKTETMVWLSFSWTCIFSRLPAFDQGLNLFSSHCNNYSCQPSVIQAITITT